MIWFLKTPVASLCVAVPLVLVALLSGCSEDRQSRPVVDGTAAEDDGTAAMSDETDEAADVSNAAPTKVEPQPQPEPEYDVADVGADDAQAGSTIGGGILTEPLHQRFHIAHRIEFLKIESAMKLYRASNGYFPKSHEEFMEKIIRENAVTLPELRDGWDYFYDAEDHELKKRKET